MYRCNLTDVTFSSDVLYRQHRLAIEDPVTNTNNEDLYLKTISNAKCNCITVDDFITYLNTHVHILNQHARIKTHISYALETELKQQFDIVKIDNPSVVFSMQDKNICLSFNVDFEAKSAYVYLQKQFNLCAFSTLKLIKKEMYTQSNEQMTFLFNADEWRFATYIYIANELPESINRPELIASLKKWHPDKPIEIFEHLMDNATISKESALAQIMAICTDTEIKDIPLVTLD